MELITRVIQISSAILSIIYYTISNFKENKFDKMSYKIEALYFLTLYLSATVSYHCI